MSKRGYAGARKAIINMNEVLQLAAQKKEPLTARMIAANRNVGTERALFYLRELEQRGKLKKLPWECGVTGFQFELIDTTPLPVPEATAWTKRGLSRDAAPRATDDAARAPSTERANNVLLQRVQRVPAKQIGMVRDAFLQAFFGDWRAA